MFRFKAQIVRNSQLLRRFATQKLDILRCKIPVHELIRDSLNIRYQNRIFKLSSITVHEKGERLFEMGDQDDRIVYLLSGCVSLQADDGKTVIVDHTHDPVYYPLAKLQPRHYSAQAITSGSNILWVDRKLLTECVAKQLRHNKLEEAERMLNFDFSDLLNKHPEYKA